MGSIFSGSGNPVSQVVNVSTGGLAGSVEGAMQGDWEKAARSGGTGGLSETTLGTNASKARQRVVDGVKSTFSPVDPINGRTVNQKDLRISAPTMNSQIHRPTVSAPTDMQSAQINFNTQQQYNPQAIAAQNQLMAQLAAQAQGQGPSLAGMQLQKGQEANLAATMAQLASQRGAANPLMQRATMQTSADIQAKTNQDMAMARLQEQLAAQGLLGQVSGQAAQQGLQQRGQDMQLATTQAGFDQQAAMTNYGGKLQSNLAQGQLDQGYNGLLSGYDMAAMQAQQMTAGNLLQNAGLGQQADMFNTKMADAAKGRQQQMYGQVLSGLSQIGSAAATGGAPVPMPAAAPQPVNQYPAEDYGPPSPVPDYPTSPNANPGYAYGPPEPSLNTYPDGSPVTPPWYSQFDPRFSDERLKTNIKDGAKDLEDFYKNLGSKKYEYKNKEHGDGVYVTPMAQELEKHPIGKSMVINTPKGKMVDYTRAAGTILSAQSLILKRLAELEKKAKK